MDKKVKDYFDKQEKYKRDIMLKFRKLILNTIPNCDEEFAWGVAVYDEGKFYLGSMKTRVHIGFAITGLTKKEIENFEGTGKTMRHLKIHSMDEYDENKLRKLIRMVHKKASCPPDYKSS